MAATFRTGSSALRAARQAALAAAPPPCVSRAAAAAAAAAPPAALRGVRTRSLTSDSWRGGSRAGFPPSRTSTSNGTKLLYAAAPFSLWSWLTGGGQQTQEPASSDASGSAPAPDGAAPPADLPTKSSSLLLPASALTQRASNDVTLVFLRTNAPLSATSLQRSPWAGWVGYFREMGYACLDVSAVHGSGRADALAKELEQQVRLQMFSRGPVLFARGALGTQAAVAQLDGGNAQFAAAVLLAPGADGVRALQALSPRVRDKLALFIADDSGAASADAPRNWKVVRLARADDADSGKLQQDVELFLVNNGF